jgi:hypothetical protein
MKKAGLMAAAMFFAAATFAQTITPAAIVSQTQSTVAQGDRTKINPGENTQLKELDSCIRQYNSEKAIAKQAMIKGEFKISKAGYAMADADKKHIKAIAAQLKGEGVRHPLMLAHKEIKKADKKVIIADVKVMKADKQAKQRALYAGDRTAVKVAENNLIADKNNLKNDIRGANRDDMKHFAFIRLKS